MSTSKPCSNDRNEHERNYGVENYGTNGFAGPIPIISSAEAQRALDQVMDECRDHGDGSKLQGNQRFKTHLYLSEISRIVHNPRLTAEVRKVLQSQHICLWSSDLNVKLPASQEFYSKHQDSTYTGLKPADKCLTVWVALSNPVGIREGCMQFLRGSHKLGQLPHVEDLPGSDDGNSSDYKNRDGNPLADKDDVKANNLLSRGQRVVLDPSKDNSADWVTIPLQAGEATFHSFFTIHESGFNHAYQPRVGLALRYMTADVRQTGAVRECITWIDPEDTGSSIEEASLHSHARMVLEQYFDLEPRLPDSPSEEDIEIGRRAHEEAMRREESNYFQGTPTVKAYDQAN